MANNLHDINGLYLVGVDGHMGIQPEVPPPHPMFYYEITCVHPFSLGPPHPNVQFNGGTPSVTNPHVSKFLWPHLPYAPDDLNLIFPLDVVKGTQRTWLPRLQVLINGVPAAPTVFPGCLSINMNCWQVGNLPTDLVLQVGTVQTTPTPADYLYGAIMWAVDFAVSFALHELDDGADGDEEEEGDYDFADDILDKIGKQVFQPPTSYSSAFNLFKSATGFDPGQAAAAAVVGHGPGSSVGFSGKGVASNVSPLVGDVYAAESLH